MATARIGSITLDCDDPVALADFWSAMLDGVVTHTTERYACVRAGSLVLTALRVPDHRPPEWPGGAVPKQMHLDLVVADLDDGAAEAVRLGARLSPEQFAPELCRVLFDPAGHPFCVCLDREPF
ncbi:VOC family protein [Gordonia neofelifaecis]|uniref:VOC domain-containing protein n=1 Tax=Gordonia neofelifaecis NRRL B-59395 TaxID=644548 RepID=F1YIF5_9ACTN|nr:VOC family protein [Gordonia neofelifaecis]EGD55709.1 hypothetical protein SCNU_08348 [Gordonia neofelifaecis NRRL B-59395]